MRPRLPTVLIAVLALLAAGCGDDDAPVPDDASATDTTTAEPDLVQRADFDLEQYEGQVVLLNFWATWCAPCRAEMPDLVQLQEEWGAEGLQIVGVAMDQRGTEAVAPYLKRQPVNYPIVLDPKAQIGETYGGIPVLPTTLVIGRDGEVRQRIPGRMRLEDLQTYVENVLADEAAPTGSAAPSS
jgi:thiol-disulfide isomerase/thioredoxin